MTTICHLFDESAGWEQRIGASQLVARTDGGRRTHLSVAIDDRGAFIARSLGRAFHRLHRVARFTPTVAPRLQRFLRDKNVCMLHAWGIEAALAGRAASSTPMVVHLFEPDLSRAQVKLVRTLVQPHGFALCCAAETVRRRLIEGGVPPESCVVVRPAVDFGLIRTCQQSDIRERLGLDTRDFLVTIPEPVGARDDALEVYWAAELAAGVREGFRLAVPGSSRGARRIARLDQVGLDTRIVIRPPADVAFEALIAVADALVVVPDGSSSTTAVAWAMAAETTVIASAEYATAELIANRVNGLLFNRKHEDGIASVVARLLLDQSEYPKLREVARGHAYEVFGLRRYLEQHQRLETNLMSGSPPGEGVVDSARVG